MTRMAVQQAPADIIARVARSSVIESIGIVVPSLQAMERRSRSRRGSRPPMGRRRRVVIFSTDVHRTLHFAECSAHLGNLQVKALKPNALPVGDRARAERVRTTCSSASRPSRNLCSSTCREATIEGASCSCRLRARANRNKCGAGGVYVNWFPPGAYIAWSI